VTVRRLPERGAYDEATIFSILDEGLVAHLGFASEDHQPYVIPTIYGRDGRTLFVHGSAASRLLRTLGAGAPMCLTVTLLDGLVLARSGFHHSMNYRSVVVLGTARVVEDREEKVRALDTIVNHVIHGRTSEVRGPSEIELKATTVLALPIDEASAKIRTGPPKDDEGDYSWPCWAGVLPLSLRAGAPVADEKLLPGMVPPGILSADPRWSSRPGVPVGGERGAGAGAGRE
jgi:nitroimidazol reductase NimA-like FMN-containing flavoprotein (pyridoxamine 5'-phosphate oxidase superfamily)